MFTEQLILLKRLLIIFGSICSIWLIIGLIFLSIQTYRHFKRRTNRKFYPYHRTIFFPPALEREDLSDDEDDRTSASTSISFISARSKIIHEHIHHPTPTCQGIIPEEPLELIFPNAIGLANLGYSRSTLSTSSDNDTSLLYYPGYRNYAYSQSTLCSSDISGHEKTPTPSLNIPLSDFSSAIRQLSHSSATTTSSQITNATYLSSQLSIKSNQLPTIMITDVDRLQTDIIELENFEPEKEFHRIKSQLRFYLNDRFP